jgi:hypothetical protein
MENQNKVAPSTAVLGLFSRIDALGLDPKKTAIAFLARRRQDPDYATLRRLCVGCEAFSWKQNKTLLRQITNLQGLLRKFRHCGGVEPEAIQKNENHNDHDGHNVFESTLCSL